jgi:hypothetical protein
MPIATVKQLCAPSAIVKSDSLVEQVAQIEDFASGRVDGRAFFKRNHFTQGLELLVKAADFQNFAKSFAYGDYATLMASTAANAARLAGAADLKGRILDGEGFAKTQLRQVLFAIWKTLDGQERDPKRGVTILKTEYAADYWQRRQKLIGLAEYVAAKTKGTRPDESAAAHELAEALKVDRL